MARPGCVPSLVRQRSTTWHAKTGAQRGDALLERTRASILGLGDVQAMAGIGGSLLGQHSPGNVHRSVFVEGCLIVGAAKWFSEQSPSDVRRRIDGVDGDPWPRVRRRDSLWPQLGGGGRAVFEVHGA